MTRIKLGKKNKGGMDAFFDELFSNTKAHPFNHNSLILGNTSIQIYPVNGEAHLSDIMTLAPKTGAATEAMKYLLHLADKHQVVISGIAKAYAKDDKYVTDTKKLISWYKKLGFKFSGDRMTYKPKRTSSMKEDAPTNSMGAGAVATYDKGLGSPKKKVKKSKFAGCECFEVDDEAFYAATNGKRKYAHYKTYVGEDETGQAIRDYGRSNPKAPIVLKNKNTGAMMYLKYGS